MPGMHQLGSLFRLGVFICAAGPLAAWLTAGSVPVLQPAEFAAPPVIDGITTDAVWSGASTFTLTNPAGAGATSAFATTARLGYDGAYIYVALNCSRPAGAADGETDRVEAFLGTSPLHYFQFSLSHDGRAAQQMVRQGAADASWRAFWAHAVRADAHGWSAEMALPLEILGRTVLPEDLLRFNVARVAGGEPGMPHTVRLLQGSNAGEEMPAILTWAPLDGADRERGLLVGEKFGRLTGLRRQRIKPTRPRLRTAAIISPYQADGTGHTYRLAIVGENRSAGPAELPVQIREVFLTPAVSPGDGFTPSPGTYQAGAASAAAAAVQPRDLTVLNLPAWGSLTNIVTVQASDAQPRWVEVGIKHPVITQTWVAAAGASLLTPGVRALSPTDLADYGCCPKAIGNPVGGGAGYDRVVTGGTHTAATAGELLALLADLTNAPEAAPGVIFIPAGAEIDLTGRLNPAARRGAYPFPFLFVPAGWTLAGDRGVNAAPGALIKFDFTAEEVRFIRENKKTHPYAGKVLIGMGAGARLTGLRVRGPDPAVLDRDYDDLPPSRFNAVYTMGKNAEVDNCEISRFHWAGVNVCHPGTRIRHNHLYDIHAYPAVIGGDAGRALLAGNRIEWSWHAIAGGGRQGTGYEAAHNEFVHVGPGGPAHAVDMHAWRQMMKGHGSEYPYLSIAGDRIVVRRNTFRDDDERIRAYRRAHKMDGVASPSHDVLLRGVPRELALVESNRFVNPAPDRACNITDNIHGLPGKSDRANFWVRGNVYGPENILIPAPLEARPAIRFVRPGLTIPRVERQFSTRQANLMRPGEKLPVAVEVSAMPPLELKRVTVTAGNEDSGHRVLFSDVRPPRPGEIVLDAGELDAGC